MVENFPVTVGATEQAFDLSHVSCGSNRPNRGGGGAGNVVLSFLFVSSYSNVTR